MKRTLVLLIALAVNLPVSAALVHHWKLDDAVSSGSTVVDSVGSKNGVTSASGVSSVTGKVGTAFLFDGATTASGGEVSVANFSTASLGAMTVTFWVKPDQNTLPAGSGVFKRLMGGADNFEVVIQQVSNKVAHNLYVGGGTYPVSVGELDDATPAWTHVAMTAQVSGTTVTTKIYLNGILDTPAASNPYTAWTGGTLKFAMRTGANNNGHFKGALDDIRIYNTVLTDAEIAVVYNPSGTTNPSPADNALGVTSPIQFSWDSVYTGAGKVSQYTLYMDTDEAKVSQETPPAGLVISGAAVTPALTSPFTGAYTYNGALINDQEYFWRADTLVLEPNNADPNNIVYNIPLKVKGGVYSFTGPLSIPVITGPADVTIQPDPQTHRFTNTTAVFTADILCSAAITNVQWFKEGNAAPLANGGKYSIVWSQTQTTLTVTGTTTADNGKYYCKVFTANTSAESSHASLYCQYILKHRYSFTGDCSDSVGGANGALVDALSTGYASYAGGELILANQGETSGDPNNKGVYVDLPNGVISALGNHATFLVWYTDNDIARNNMRIYDFGSNAGGENVSGAASGNAANDYIYLTPKQSATNAPQAQSVKDGSNITVNGAVQPVNGVQVCVAVVWDGTANQMSMYVNGVKAGGNPTLNQTLSSLTDFNNWLGRSQFPGDARFIGKYNEFRIYDVALTPAWITEIYAEGPDSLNLDPCILPSGDDTNGDCKVDITDLAVFVAKWLSCGLLVCP